MSLPNVSTAAVAAAAAASTSVASIALAGAGLDTSGKRERTKFNEKQVSILESVFSECQYPQGGQRESLARELNLTETKVQVWFKNRRAKFRAQQKYEQLKLDVGASNKRFNGSTNGVGNERNSSGDAASLFSTTSTGSNELGLTAPFAPNGGVLMLHKDSAQALTTVASHNSIGGASVGDTEDENEGTSTNNMTKNGDGSNHFALKDKPTTMTRLPQFPSSMPMIPLPTNSLEDIKSFDKSHDNTNTNNSSMTSNSVVTAAAAAAAAAMFPFSAANGGNTISNSTFLPAYPNMYQNYNQPQTPLVKAQSSAAFTTNGFDLSSMANSFNPLAQGWMGPNYPSMLNMMNGFGNGTASMMANGTTTDNLDFIGSSGTTPAQSAASHSTSSPSAAAAAAAAAMSGCYVAAATPPLCATAGTAAQMYDLYNSYYHPPSASLWGTKLA